jgi:hypothetical protein
MTPEEIQMVDQWIAYGRSDEAIGANWHQHVRNRGGNPPQETLTETGRRLREQVSKEKGGLA